MSFSRGGRDHGAGNPGSSGAGDAGGGHIGNLKHYFGDVNPQYSKMLAEDKFAHETYNLPKAYEGKNKYLEKVIDYLITNENDWYTSQVLPWVETDDLHLKWEIFRFNKTLMDLEPHQGVPRYVTAEREARSDRLVRRGLAFIIEHGFYTTAEGKQHYLMNLRQIVDSVNETAYHGVVYALLSADNHYKEWHRQHGSRVQRPGDLQRAGKRLWAVVQKQERGLYLLDAELKDTMRYEGVNPDTWIVPSKMSIYVTMVDGPTPLKYSDGGPSTQGALEAGPSRFQTFRGSKVFESRPFDIDFIGEPYDLLVRRRQIGEHFTLGGKDTAAGSTLANNSQIADSGLFDSYLYSMDVDNFERVEFIDAAAKGLAALANISAQDQRDVISGLQLGQPSLVASEESLWFSLYVVEKGLLAVVVSFTFLRSRSGLDETGTEGVRDFGRRVDLCAVSEFPVRFGDQRSGDVDGDLILECQGTVCLLIVLDIVEEIDVDVTVNFENAL